VSVNKEPSGRRSMVTEFEVAGTPEEVWQAIATGPGVSSWFVPTEFEERDGTPVAMKVRFGPWPEMRSDITAWDPPQMFATMANGWLPGSPPIASEWSVEARDGGKCVVRIVQSLFASTDDWDMQLESAKTGFASFLKILQINLAHFRGQQSAMQHFAAPAPGTEAESWAALTAALGLRGMTVGQRFTAPAGVPALSGVVEYATEDPFDAVLRLDQPAPGVAALGIAGMPGGPFHLAMVLHQHGDQAAETLARETPRWEAWFQQQFPTPGEASAGK
jgi:uncharacterized protein YndB with AHSA1/START domain